MATLTNDYYMVPDIAPKRLATSEAGPPLFKTPATIQATAHIPIRPAVTLNAVTATFEISVEPLVFVPTWALLMVVLFFMVFPVVS